MQIRNEFFRASARNEVSQQESEGVLTESQTPSVPVKWRKVNRSPDEEFATRLARVQPLKKFPDTVVAAFLYHFKELKVQKNGVQMKVGKMPYTFWHPNSMTCANEVGNWVNVAYQPESLDWIAVLDAQGGVVEIIPLKSRAAWFDDEEFAKVRAQKHAAHQRLKDRFETIHEPTSEERINRHLRNSERMQIVNTLPAPAALASRASDDTGPDNSVRTERGTSFSRSGDLAAADRSMTRQRVTGKRREATEKDLAEKADAALARAALRQSKPQTKEPIHDDSY